LDFMRRLGSWVVVLFFLGFVLVQNMMSVAAVNDTTPPVFQSLSVSSATVAAGGTVTLTARVTDDLSGVGPNSVYGNYVFSGPSGQTISAYFTRISGTALDGIYQAYLAVPAAYPPGMYHVGYLSASDASSNSGYVQYPDPPTDSGSITVGNAAPTLSGLNPSSVPAGGDPFNLAVFGSNFQSGAIVYWNGSPRTTAFVSPTQLAAAITAADIANTGAASISVINPDGQGSATSLSFTISVPPPRVQSVTPNHGPATGGTSVTITGKYFQPGATVTFNGVSATGVTVVSTTQINAVTPAYSGGVQTSSANIVVKNPDNQSGTLGAGYNYVLRPGAEQPGAQPNPDPGGSRTIPSNPGSAPNPMPAHR
jgi:IPT/TIG domain